MAEIKDISCEGRRAFCCYDTPMNGNVAHADVCQAHPPDRKSVRAGLRRQLQKNFSTIIGSNCRLPAGSRARARLQMLVNKGFCTSRIGAGGNRFPPTALTWPTSTRSSNPARARPAGAGARRRAASAGARAGRVGAPSRPPSPVRSPSSASTNRGVHQLSSTEGGSLPAPFSQRHHPARQKRRLAAVEPGHALLGTRAGIPLRVCRVGLVEDVTV